MNLRVARLLDVARLPARKNRTDAGMDFYAAETRTLGLWEIAIIRTGVTVEVPEGFMLLVKPKSRNNHLVGGGIVDAYYHPGEILVKVVNTQNKVITINRGDAIAQGILVPVLTPQIEEVSAEELRNGSPRSGSGGIVGQVNE